MHLNGHMHRQTHMHFLHTFSVCTGAFFKYLSDSWCYWMNVHKNAITAEGKFFQSQDASNN